MEKLTKSQIRNSFIADIGHLLWEERQKKRLTLDKSAVQCGQPKGVVDRIEIGRCHDVHRIFRLCAFYSKKIKVELVD